MTEILKLLRKFPPYIPPSLIHNPEFAILKPEEVAGTVILILFRAAR